jgi:hypothetical protein
LKEGFVVTFEVRNLTPREVIEMVQDEIVSGSFSGDLVDLYEIETSNNSMAYVAVFEKYFYRVSNMITATVVASETNYGTKVHVVSAGSSQGWLMKFDWGASSSFEKAVKRCLEEYIY